MHAPFADRYPREAALPDGTRMTLTPMVPSDWQLLAEFLKGTTDEDRQFLRHDVSDLSIVERWCAELDYRHTLPLLAWIGGRIVADGTLHQEPDLWTAHVGKVRLLVHPEFRGRGIGSWMVRELVEVARDLNLHRVVAECAADQKELIGLLEHSRFKEMCRLPEFIRDRKGGLHDMVLMVYTLKGS